MALSWQYIAGFFDGEGNISVPLGKQALHVCITQAGTEGIKVLTDIKDFLASHGIRSVVDKSAKKIDGRKKVYRLVLAAQRAESFLRMMFPYLIVKKVAAQDVLRYRKLFVGMMTSPLCSEWRSEICSARNKGRTHCKRGHPLTEDNLYKYLRRGKPSKACKACAKMSANARYRRIYARP